MRLPASIIVICALSCAETSSAGQPLSPAAMVCMSPSGAERPRPVSSSDETAAARLGELLDGSTIVREMIAYLGTAQVMLTVQSSISLMRDHRSGGLSRFAVHNEALVGRIEFDRTARDISAQRITLAHEIGHAVELAALPRRNTAALAHQLLDRIGQHAPWSSQLVIETPFARDVDARVESELKYGAAPAGTLDTLSRRHHLLLTCSGDQRHAADAGIVTSEHGKKD